MTRSLTALFEPASLIRTAQRDPLPPPTAGLALLLEGRLQLYRAIAGRASWPELGEEVNRRHAAELRLLGAIGRHFTGAEGAEPEYRSLIRASDLDVAMLALLLLSFLYSDDGQKDAAVKLLSRGAPKFRTSPLYRTLIALQLGVRLAEQGRIEEAIGNTNEAQRLARGATPATWGRALRTIAEHNLFAYGSRLQPFAPGFADLPLTSEQPILNRGALLVEEGASEFLNTTFERSLADPYSRSVTYQAADPVEVPLQGAAIRSELLSDWANARQARRLLGRYLIVSRLGTPNGVPAPAFELLRRSGDAKGVGAIARTVSHIGPLGPLRLFVSALVEKFPFDDEPAASLAVLQEAAHLLGPDDAAEAVAQLIRAPTLFAQYWSTSSRVLAELVRSAPSTSQTDVATFVRSLLANPDTHSEVVQEVSHVVQAIRWAEVDPRERDEWTPIIENSYEAPTDARFAAANAVIALAGVDPEMVERVLREHLTDAPTIDAVAVLFSVLDPPPDWARKWAWPAIATGLQTIRDSAAQGSYGFGGVDVARLAVVALGQPPQRRADWQILIKFLRDPKVDAAGKVGALDSLGRPTTHIPRGVQTELRAVVDSIAAVTMPLGVSSETFEATKLKLALRFGGMSSAVILARLLVLAGNPSIQSRVLAARVVASAPHRLGHEVALTIALTLSHDVQPDVRGAAGAALALMVGAPNVSLEQSRRARLRDLLDESGVVTPIGVLAGLYGALEADLPVDPELGELVRALQRHHPSRRVRDAAERVLEAMSQ